MRKQDTHDVTSVTVGAHTRHTTGSRSLLGKDTVWTHPSRCMHHVPHLMVLLAEADAVHAWMDSMHVVADLRMRAKTLWGPEGCSLLKMRFTWPASVRPLSVQSTTYTHHCCDYW